jgi:O-antigen ligase
MANSRTVDFMHRSLWLFFWLALALMLLTSSYDFYHVNSYKVVLALTTAVLLLPLIGFLIWHRRLIAPPLSLVAITLVPLASTVPGWIAGWIEGHGRWNYLAGEQLSQWLIILSWAWLGYALSRHAAPANGKRQKKNPPAPISPPTRPLIEPIATGLHFLGGASAIIALVDVATRGFELLTVGTGLRATGSYGNPNYLAAFLLLALPLSSLRVWLGATHQDKPRRAPIFFADVATLLLIICALSLTQTRLAQLLTVAFAIVVAALWIFRYHRKQAPLLIVAVLLGTAFVMALAWQLQLPWLFRFKGLLNGNDFAARLVPWEAAFNAWRDAPWIGHGPGSFYTLFFQYVNPESRAYWLERSFIHPHNALLDAAVEGGLLGVIGYVIFWGAALWLLWRGARHGDSVRKAYFAATLAGLVIYLIYSQFDVTYRMLTVTLPCLLALAAAVANQHDLAAAKKNQRALWALWLLLLVAAWGVGLSSLQSKYRMMQIETTLKGAPRIDALVALRDDNPNVYASERLLYAALAQKNWPLFFTTARALEQQIPNFRVTRHLIATAFAQRGDLRNARKAALDFQSRDRYFAPNNRLLARIALATDDRELLMRQLAIAAEYALKEQRLIGKHWSDVRARIGATTDIAIDDTNGSVTLTFNKELFDMLVKGLADFYSAPDQAHAAALQFLLALAFKDSTAIPPNGVNFQSVLPKVLEQVL